MATNRLLALLLICLCRAAWPHEAASPAACQAAAEQPAIAVAKAALDADPADLRVRLKLADAWSDAGCFGDTLQVLQGGEALHPGNKELQTRLRVAKSLVGEQNYFDSMDRAAKNATLSRAAFRCAKLADVSACDDALSMKPDDPELLVAKADSLMQLKRLGEAIGTYRNALPTAADREAVNAKIALAESQRRTFLDTCETKIGDAALRACESAWLPGAPDEVTVFRRRGLLLQTDNRLSSALDAYMAAARLDPGDHSAALAIVSLSDSTGRQDAATLAARGRALMALGRPSEALEPLRQALRLVPDLAEAKAELRLALLSPKAGREVRAATDRTGGSASGSAGGSAGDKPPAVGSPPTMAAANAGAAIPRRYSNDAPVTRSN
jgi:tetratricopeptide (TPR) repeat protein